MKYVAFFVLGFVVCHELPQAFCAEKARDMTSGDMMMATVTLRIYEDTTGRLPNDIYAADKKTRLLSFRVELCKFDLHRFGRNIEFSKLYNKFKLNEPWYTPTNLKVAEEIPAIFSDPREPGSLFSPYQGVESDEYGFGAICPKGRPAVFEGRAYGLMVPVDKKAFFKLHEKEDRELPESVPEEYREAVRRLIAEKKQWPWTRPGGIPFGALLNPPKPNPVVQLTPDGDQRLWFVNQAGGLSSCFRVTKDAIIGKFAFPDDGSDAVNKRPKNPPHKPDAS